MVFFAFIRRTWTQHPHQNCMTVWEHANLSFNISNIFFLASCKAFVHAIIPCLYVKSSSDTIKSVQKLLNESGCLEEEKALDNSHK